MFCNLFNIYPIVEKLGLLYFFVVRNNTVMKNALKIPGRTWLHDVIINLSAYLQSLATAPDAAFLLPAPALGVVIFLVIVNFISKNSMSLLF